MKKIMGKQKIFLAVTIFATTAHAYMQAASTKKQATVRIGTALGADEAAYLIKRTDRVKQVLQTLLAMELNSNQVPRIAFCASGGGYRAMLNTLGSLQAANDQTKRNRSLATVAQLLGSSAVRKFIVLLAQYFTAWFGGGVPTLPLPADTHSVTLFDATTYCAGVSGSTWALAGWIQSRSSLDAYGELVTTGITENLFKYIDFKHVALTLSKKIAFKQPLSLIDIYGVLLARALLTGCGLDNPCEHTLSTQQEYVATGMIPFPIYTSIIGEESPTYEWVEFNPFEVSCPYLNAHIPAWAFGRTFSNGVSQDFASEQSLGYCMGIWGSAMSMNAREFLNVMEPHLGSELEGYFDPAAPEQHESDLQEIFASIVSKPKKRPKFGKLQKRGEPIFERRFSPARVANWGFGSQAASLNTDPLLTLVDGGIDINLPIPPLLRPERAVDIIIILDASGSPVGKHLLLSQQYAKDNNLKFPVIDVTSLDNRCSVHKDLQDPECPIVIYMPLMKNENYENGWDPHASSFTITENFTYTKDQSQLLMGLAQFNMQENLPVILKEIREWVATHP